MKAKGLIVLLFIIAAIHFSCTPYKRLPYFQDVKTDSLVTEKIDNYTPLTMQPGDLLGIYVSSLNHEADMLYNNNLVSQGRSAIDRPEQTAVVGYSVDEKGNINFPVLGAINVSGLTTTGIAALLQKQLLKYLSKPTVTVRILNFKISVLGDVKAPGSFNIQNERITLTEALSLAGDLNTTAVRNRVLVIREKDGQRQYVKMNLTSKDVLNSPYYYLKNNDVVYVKPSRAKALAEDAAFQRAGILISALSIVVYILRR